jgi:sec-independent protein translocase protein TatA
MSATIFMGMIGGPQIILIVVAILLLFGGRKIPELMRGLGGGIKEFKDAVKEDEPKEPSKDDPKDNKS